MRKKKDLSFKNNQQLFETKMLKVKLKMILQKKLDQMNISLDFTLIMLNRIEIFSVSLYLTLEKFMQNIKENK